MVTASDVAKPTEQYDEDCIAWKMVDDLWGGTKKMREASHEWLPIEEKESSKAYDARVKRSFLYNGYKRAVGMIVGKPFSKPVTLKRGETLPEPLDLIEKDVDKTGRPLTKFAKEILQWAVHYGVHFVLVDFPARKTKDEEGNTIRTLEDDRREKVRPLFIQVKATQLIGFRTEEGPDKVERLSQIRIREEVVVEDGNFGTKKEMQIRVVDQTSYSIYRDGGNGEFKLDSTASHSFGYVPLFPFYTNETGFMRGQPVLEDLAWKNIEHWQSSSDQRSILRFARIGILFGSGFSKQEKKDGFVIGSNRAVVTENEKANLKFVEHTGQSIGSGERDIDKIEAQMRALAIQPFLKQTGNETATARAIDTSETHSMVQSWIRMLEDYIEDLYRTGGRIVGREDIGEEFSVEIQKEFELPLHGSEDSKELREMAEAEFISHETYLREVKRRSLLSETLDVEQELDRVRSQAPRNPGPQDPLDIPGDPREPETSTIRGR